MKNPCNDPGSCKVHTLRASIGSSVLLPCNFSSSTPGSVSWGHMQNTYLLHLKSEGQVKFVDPRNGRVKVFPNQGSEGNYSICIDDLKYSDLGCYQCQSGGNCLSVKLVPELTGEFVLVWELVQKKCNPFPFHGYTNSGPKVYERTVNGFSVSCETHLCETTSHLA